MFIHCTNKMLDKLNVQPETDTEQGDGNGLFSWHANITRINGRQSAVFMNNNSQYVIVLFGLKAKDFSRMDSLFKQAIRMVWREEGIKEILIDDYLARAGGVQFGKTKNRSFVARLNRSCKEMTIFEKEINSEQLIQSGLSIQTSKLLAGDGKGGYIHPNEVLYEGLQQLYGGGIFSVRAVEVNVQLMLETREVWRRMVIPLNRTFPQLHKILQEAFGWWNSHLHEFYVFERLQREAGLSYNHPGLMSDGTQALVNLVSNQEAFDYPDEIPMQLEAGIKLSEYLPAAKQLIYVYDFGDDWRHRIDVMDVIESYPSNHPVCLDGTGEAPPEDVGGEGGYADFLAIMDNPEHPDHAHMKRWAGSQLYEAFDLKRINRILKRL
ncbi:hypothetical protein GCM10009001_05110 [Virgibacillus siamensis]|uniref:Uncharacterized protein n=1 Tax=Virgibacillus siamensis TaxID=480071 RepID=A0ABN1FJ80_9BACI